MRAVRRIIGFNLILAVIILLVLLLRSNIFSINSVYVETEKIDCADLSQIKHSSNLLGQNFFLLNASKVEESIKNKFICVKDVTASRHFPARIDLFVSGRVPVAMLSSLDSFDATASSLENIATPSAQTSSDSYLVDEGGVIFSKMSEQSELPNIFFKEVSLSLGQKLENKDALKILQRVKTFGLDIQISILLDNYLIIFSLPRVVFRTDEKVDIQLASLQLILEKAKIDENNLEFIDLRFDKPVVKFAPKK